MEFSCEALLDAMAQKQYKYLKFGGSPAACIGVLGKASAKSVEKIRDTYRIPKDELIAAHLTKKILLITDGVLMTDHALYVNPSYCPDGASNRIPWSELHKYFVSHPTIQQRPSCIDQVIKDTYCYTLHCWIRSRARN